jgi:NAD(P)-dependent dehydrogenase (short-subunit alcohol dehydrogenase family)
MRLQGKTAIVTGAGAGIGEAIALRFLEEGANVVSTDVAADRVEALREKASAFGARSLCLVSDVGEPDQIESMFDQAVATFGRLDILVNNAGVMDNFEPVGEVEDAKWDRIMRINVDGPFRAMRRAVHLFLAQPEGGVILNIGSIGGLNGARAGAAYTTSKFALVGLTKNTAYMYSKSGIRCNAIAPGGVVTRIGETIDMENVSPLVKDRIFSGMVTNPRMGESGEIASTALFLCSDEASYVNGAVVIADGGWTAF